jgi:membrane protease YdiL (CAAX protease family)
MDTSAEPGPPSLTNAREVLEARVRAGQLTLAGPVVMLFARTVLAFLSQAAAASLFLLRGHPDPWLAAAPWFTVAGTLVDLGSLALIAWLARREGTRLVDLIGLDRAGLRRDLLWVPAMIVIFLVVGIASGAAVGVLLYGATPPPQIMGPLPLWAAVYSVFVWPVLWGLAEQLTYNGYTLPRLQALTGRTWLAVLLTCLGFGLQHIALPNLPDARFLLYRFLPPVLIGLVVFPLYLRRRRLLPFIVAHWFADVLSTLTQVLLPLLA